MHRLLYLLLVLLVVAPLGAQGETPVRRTEQRVAAVESRVSQLESKVRSASTAGAAAFLFGAFCALWAQNTGRSAWLWFLLGLFFSVITVLVLLAKNSGDIDRAKRSGRRSFNLQDFRQQ